MTPPAPLATTSLIVVMDYGQFSLASGERELDYLQALTRALDGEGVSQDDGLVVVISPHQNNFAMPVEIEVWADPPPDDLAAWPEVVQAGLQVSGGGFWWESPTDTRVFCPVPDGRYAVRVSGRDFVGYGWPGSTTPGDSWRIQLWPVDVLPTPVRLARYVQPPAPEPDPEPDPAPSEPPEPEGGLSPSPQGPMRGIFGGIGTPENPGPAAAAWLATGLSGVHHPNLLPPGVEPGPKEPPAPEAPGE
jgi:hypothetical protein